MTTSDITRALRRFWPLSVAVFLLLIGIGAAAAFVPKEKYQANALLFAEPTNPQALNSSATVVPLILPAIVEQVGTREFDNRLFSANPPARGATLSASNVAGTTVLTVTAESTDPQTAAIAANAAANQLRLNPITSTLKLSLLNPAYPPTSASSPQKMPILLGCAVLGVILAMFAALGADAARKRVAGPEAIRERFGLTVLGEIGNSRQVRRTPAELFDQARSSETAEEYQRLRTSFSLLAKDYRTVAVTSWREKEGKTTVTANLGWMLASLGREVTIVDLDLRRPSMHVPFGLPMGNGVGELSSHPTVESARPRRLPGGPGLDPVRRRMKPSGLAGLDILTAGTVTEESARVIEKVLPEIKQTFENRLVLIDTAPLVAAETALVASMVDALVIVIDMRRRQPAELDTLLQVLNLTQTAILGVVLNRVRRHGRSVGYHALPDRESGRGSRRGGFRNRLRKPATPRGGGFHLPDPESRDTRPPRGGSGFDSGDAARERDARAVEE